MNPTGSTPSEQSHPEQSAPGASVNPEEPGKVDATSTEEMLALGKQLAEQASALSEQASSATLELTELFKAEMQLTFDDSRRLLLTWVALVPALILAWMSLSALATWIVYDLSTSVTLALSALVVIQLALCTLLFSYRKRFRSGLGFPRSKARAHQLFESMTNETTGSDQQN